MSDLASLLQYAPYAAGNMIANNNITEDQLNQQRIQELKQIILAKQQEYGQNEQMNPLLIAQQQNKNNYDTQVKIPQGLEQLTKDKMANQFTQATQPGKIATTNADSATHLARDMQDRITRIATSVQSQPAPLRMQALQQGLQAEGIDPNTPLAQGMVGRLKDMDPNQWGGYFSNLTKQLGQYAANQDTKYLGDTQAAQTHADATKYSADKHANATVEAARISAEARLGSAKLRYGATDDILANYKAGKVPPDRAMVGLSLGAQMALNEAKVTSDPEQRQALIDKARMYGEAAHQAEQFVYNKAAAANTGKPGYVDGNITTTQAPSSVLSPEVSALIGAGQAQKAAPAPKQGQTSSGAKYTIIQTK